MDFTGAMVNGLPLLTVVLGLVAWVKGWGVEGNALRASSMIIGLLLGVGYMFGDLGLPATFGGWFGFIVYGLGLGLTASGIYDAGAGIVAKAMGEFALKEKVE